LKVVHLIAMQSLKFTGIETTDAHRRALYVVSVACFPIIVAGFLTQIVFFSGAVQRDDGIGHQTKYAYFNYPVTGDLVEGQFEVSGRVESIPADGTVHLVERVDNRFWPKLRIGTEPTNFQRTQFVNSGKGYKYTIELLSVNAAVEAQIDSWFEYGNKTGEYNGIDINDGVTVLAKVRVVHR